jgi:hypothetical protein
MSDDRFGAIAIHPDPATPQKRAQKTPRRPKPGQRPQSSKPVQDDQRTKRWLILAAIPVLLLLIYGVGGFFLGPSHLTDYLLDSLYERTNIGLTAGKARFNPFTLRLELGDVTSELSGAAGQSGQSGQSSTSEASLVKIDHLAMDLKLSSLLGQDLSCTRLDLRGVTVSLIRHPEKSYNLPTPAKNSAADAPADTALPFSLNNISISDSTILFDDRLAGKKHRVEQIKLDLPSLSDSSMTDKEYIRPHFSAIINGSPVELTGEAAMAGKANGSGLATTLACNIHNLDLPLYFAYLPQWLPLTLSKGRGNGTLKISFIPDRQNNSHQGGRLTIDFELATTDIELANKEKTLTMGAPALEINGSLQPLDGGLHLHTVHILGPQLSAVSATFAQDLASFFSEPATENGSTKQSRQFAIDTLSVENGTLQLLAEKHQQQTPASPPWTSVQLDLKKFTTSQDQNKEQGTFSCSGKQEQTNAALSWQGSLNNRGVPGGILQLQAFSAGTILGFIGLDKTAVAAGLASFSGHLSFDPRTDPKAQNSRRINLMDAAVNIQDLILLDHKQTWLTAKTMQIKGAGLKGDNLDLGTISLTGAALTLRQDHLPPLFSRFADNSNPILLQGLDFSGSATLIPHNEKAAPLKLTELRLKASELANKSNTQKNFECSTRMHESGTLKAEGLAALSPMRAQLSLTLNTISAEQVAPWLPEAPLFQQGRAIIDGQGTFHYPESSFTGNLYLGSPLFRTDDKGPGLTADKAELTNISIKARPVRIGMDELALDTPLFTWQRETNGPGPAQQIGIFLRNLLPPAKTNGKELQGNQQGQGNPAIPRINKISFEHGTVKVSDLSLTPPWSPAITELKGTITNPLEKNQDTGFEITGLIETAPFTLSGTTDFLTPEDSFSTRLEVTGLPLSTLESQIGPLLDINPKSGSVNLSLTHDRHNGEEQGEARFLFTGLRPNSAQSATALPLALLTDEKEQVKLLVPLAKDSPQPLLSQTIAAFQTLRVKAEISPFLLTGTEFVDLQDTRQIFFPPGQSTLEIVADKDVPEHPDAKEPQSKANGEKTLHRFADLLTKRPRLGLLLTGMADPAQDRAAIQNELEEKEKKRTAKKNEQRLQEWQKKQKQKQQAQANKPPQIPVQGKIVEEDLGPQDAPPALLAPEPVKVPDSMLHDLAQERVLQVYDFLTSNLGIASARITLQEKTVLSNPETIGNQVIIGLQPLSP